MGRYYFHRHDDLETEDTVGRELMNSDAAWRQAMTLARTAAASEVLGLGTLSLSHRIDVTDERGELVTTVRLAEAVRVRS